MVTHSNTVGLDFGRAMFGSVGGIIFAAIVAMSCFGAVNRSVDSCGHRSIAEPVGSSFFTSSRVVLAAAKDGYLPKWFARVHVTRKTPVNSIVSNVAASEIIFLTRLPP